MLLLIDNYDSFVFNLARYFRRLGQETRVVRNDAFRLAEIRQWQPAAIVISPGPCTPYEAGRSLEVVQTLWTEFPILGVCLGHQTIAAAFGAAIVRAPQPMHGRARQIAHNGQGIFANVPQPLTAGRYHSLIVDENSLPACLQITARTPDGLIMGLQHHQAPVVGVQFHPESILTECGYELLSNFLRLAGLESRLPQPASERLPVQVEHEPELPRLPVTF